MRQRIWVQKELKDEGWEIERDRKIENSSKENMKCREREKKNN
jgi:hypothetical protein